MHSLKVRCRAGASPQASAKLPALGPSCGGRSWVLGVGSWPTSCPAAREPLPPGAGGQGFHCRVLVRFTEECTPAEPQSPGSGRDARVKRTRLAQGAWSVTLAKGLGGGADGGRGRGPRRAPLRPGGGTDGGRGCGQRPAPVQPLRGEGCGQGRFRAAGRGRGGRRKGAGPEVVPRWAAGLAGGPGRAREVFAAAAERGFGPPQAVHARCHGFP